VVGNRRLQIMAKTIAGSGAGDRTKAVKRVESFGLEDETPATSITGPLGVQPSTTFTMTGRASDDKGVKALSYWFRDEQGRYLQDDGTVDDVYHAFRGAPDVVGAASATWSYDVTVPHEGVWRGSATAIDTNGQADLRSAVHDWRVDSTAIAPRVTIVQPVKMSPPTSVATVVVAPGEPMTFSGTATDDAGLKNVEITLRNTTTRENLAADGTWGLGVTAGQHRVSPADITGSTYSWSWTTPFSLSAGSYTFTVRATDDEEITTPTTQQGRLTIQGQVPGDLQPNGLLTGSSTAAVALSDPTLDLGGTATADRRARSVDLTVYDSESGRYLQDDGTTMSAAYNRLVAGLAFPNSRSTAWTRRVILPTAGDFTVTAFAYDTAGQQDSSTLGATARFRYFPGDALPRFETAGGQPVDGSTFTQSRIVVTGRALDDVGIAGVDVAVMNSAGRYMSSTGTFSSTTPSWRAAFLNSPGSPGSNYSYTTPVIPSGTYTVQVRPTDVRDQVGPVRTARAVVVSP